jgi:16S rRNA (guanine966-N2)-methyltransferase
VSKRTGPRIIAGELRGSRLKSPQGNITRPITDRVKENLFNIIGADIIDARFLDLFAGTGSVGIEAYSRGASFVHFIEKNQTPFVILEQNLELIKDKKFVQTSRIDAFKFVSSYKGSKFDYIFIAPPQYKGMWKKSLELVNSSQNILEKNGIVIVQIDPIENEEITLENLVETDKRRYGSTLLLFFKAHII